MSKYMGIVVDDCYFDAIEDKVLAGKNLYRDKDKFWTWRPKYSSGCKFWGPYELKKETYGSIDEMKHYERL